MASVQEKIAASLAVLKDYQDKHADILIKGVETLGKTHTTRLIEAGFLEPIIKGWYMPTFPGREGDSSVWYACFWQFVTAYFNSKYGDDWCLTPEESLAFHSGNYLVPKQLIVRSPKAKNNIVKLKYDTSVLDISAGIAKHRVLDSRYGVPIYSLAEALCFASPAVFQSDSINVRTCLASVESASDILRVVAEDGNSTRAARIAGAMQNIGRADIADEIIKVMTRLGFDMRVSDPFIEKIVVPPSDSPYSTRIRLAWREMREQILSNSISPIAASKLSNDDVLKTMDEQYVHDAYHSLSIEGYRVTEALIERVRSGSWHPEEGGEDADRKNALAARGYYQAFLKVRESVVKILNGIDAGEVFEQDHNDWHFELFQPCVQAGIISPADLMGYRTHQVYIRGSKHTPLHPDALRPAMLTLCELMKEEPDAVVRALLGHFFFVYIHPYMDGNGRTARFILNVMLASANLPWTIIPVEQRTAYIQSLEKASTERDILPFARFVTNLLQTDRT